MRIVRAAGIVISLALVAVFGGGHLLRAAALAYPGPNGPGAFHLILLLLAAPVVVVSGIVLLLAPGVLPLAGTPQPSQGEVLLKGALVALVVDAAGFGLVKLVLGPEPSPAAFRGMAALLPVLGWVALLLQCRRAGPAGPEALRFLPGLALRVALVAGLAVLLLFPVLFWQDLNPDGLELFTAGRSLAQFLLPHLPTGRLPGLGLGMLTSAGLVHWFQVLFGTLDATARLPVVTALPLLYGATLALIESGAARGAGLTERGLVLLALCAVVATLVCNDTYHPYSTDPASPSGVDVLLLVFLAMQVYFLWTEQRIWFLLATALAYLTRPTGLLLPLILGVALVLAGGERRWARLRLVALGVLLCLLIQIGYERIYGALAGASFFEPSAEIGGRRLRYLSFWQWKRVLYVLLPSGMLPALSLLWWRRQDHLSRILTLSTVGYFGFFYFPSFTALHHFAPVMLLPLAVFWRLLLARAPAPRLQVVTLGFALMALWLALPNSASVDRSTRALGRETLFLAGDYDGDYAAWRGAFRHKDLVDSLFTPYCEATAPDRERVVGAWTLVRYARKHGDPDDPAINYLILGPGGSAPPRYTRVATDTAGGTVWVADRERWAWERSHPPPTGLRSRMYAIPLAQSLPCLGLPAGRYDVDLRQFLGLAPR